jgi:hypothetical protein
MAKAERQLKKIKRRLRKAEIKLGEFSVKEAVKRLNYDEKVAKGNLIKHITYLKDERNKTWELIRKKNAARVDASRRK